MRPQHVSYTATMTGSSPVALHLSCCVCSEWGPRHGVRGLRGQEVPGQAKRRPGQLDQDWQEVGKRWGKKKALRGEEGGERRTD